MVEGVVWDTSGSDVSDVVLRHAKLSRTYASRKGERRRWSEDQERQRECEVK